MNARALLTATAPKPDSERPRDIGIFGTFDVKNYGDLLFPIVAKHHLKDSDINLVTVSPTNISTGWDDALTPVSIVDVVRSNLKLDGILIGGGNIIHNRPAGIVDYKGDGIEHWAYASLWMGATLLGCIRDVPIAWNSPGVPASFGQDRSSYMLRTLQVADYVSVRDRSSLEMISAANMDDLSIVPDTALDISQVWRRRGLTKCFRDVLARQGELHDRQFVAIHVKERSVDTSLPELAKKIDDFSEATGLTPILIAIGPCHDDDRIARGIRRYLKKDSVDLSNPHGLREIAAAIACSRMYIGASMHGYITSMSYGNPSLIIGMPVLPKMSGLLEHLGRSTDLVPNWEAGLSAALSLANGRGVPKIGLPSEVRAGLDSHWDAVRGALASRSAKSRDRFQFLRYVTQRGVAYNGWGWAMSSFLKAR